MENQATLQEQPLTTVPVLDLSYKPRIGETIIQGILFFCGVASILTTAGIVLVLGQESLRLFVGEGISITEFLTSTDWNPSIDRFGVLPLLTSTLVTSFFAMLVSIPLGLGSALFLSEYATPRVR